LHIIKFTYERKKDSNKFKTPGLRNVSLTKPYFHDGSRQTLYDAVGSMAKYQSGTKLNDVDIKAIVLFLNTLASPQPPPKEGE